MKSVSILGDSLSTFEGCNPKGYNIFYNREVQRKNGITDVQDTWWAQVLHAMDCSLCVNASFSGSCVTGNRFPSASSREQINDLRSDFIIPDIILIYIGFNDFGNGVAVGPAPAGCPGSEKNLYFETAYESMLSVLRSCYPAASIICSTIMRTAVRQSPDWSFPEFHLGNRLEDYNRAIRNACRQTGCVLADIASFPVRYETLDGTHPTKNGYALIASAWIRVLSDAGYLSVP